MSNIYWGVTVVVFCCFLYLWAFRKQKAEEHGYALAIVMLGGLVLRVYVAGDPFLHSWDERYHALVAKHLLNHFFKPTLYEDTLLRYDYTNWTANHIWVHKQPVSLWLIAISLKLFGVNAFAVRIPSIILSTVGVKLVYDIARHLYDRRVAFIAAFLCSINGLILDLASGREATDHVDVFFLFFITLGVWFSCKYVSSGRRAFVALIGVATGLAVLTKWMPAYIVVALWLLLVWGWEPRVKIFTNLLIILFISAIVWVPWQLHILHAYPVEATYEYQFNRRHIFEVLNEQGGGFLYHFNYLRIMFGELVYLSVIWFLYKAARNRNTGDLLISVWFLVPYLFFSFVATKMPAYIILSAPAVFIITAQAYISWKQITPSLLWQKRLLAAVTICLLLLPVRYTIERMKPFNKMDYPAWANAIDRYKRSDLNTGKTILLNFDHPIEMMFSTNIISYNYIPDSLDINRLAGAGYNIKICNK